MPAYVIVEITVTDPKVYEEYRKLTPFQGVAVESSRALLLFGTEAFGIPVSTTNNITGAIIGTGMTKRVSAVHCGVGARLLWAWVLTIPVSMLIAMGVYFLMSLF
jgi:inorganic phosphate transporter, PiT family